IAFPGGRLRVGELEVLVELVQRHLDLVDPRLLAAFFLRIAALAPAPAAELCKSIAHQGKSDQCKPPASFHRRCSRIWSSLARCASLRSRWRSMRCIPMPWEGIGPGLSSGCARAPEPRPKARLLAMRNLRTCGLL